MKGAKAVASFPTLVLKYLKSVKDFQSNLKYLQRNAKLGFTSGPVTFLHHDIGQRR